MESDSPSDARFEDLYAEYGRRKAELIAEYEDDPDTLAVELAMCLDDLAPSDSGERTRWQAWLRKKELGIDSDPGSQPQP